MMATVLTLRFNPLLGRFDDQPLVEFSKDKNLITVRDHLFTHDGLPCLALVITYRPGELLVPDESSSSSRSATRDRDWRQLLSDKALPVFNSLRQWRSGRARADGLPSYLICTNRQFAMMAESRPQTLEALQDIEGFGQARAEKYGQDILDIISRSDEAASQSVASKPEEKIDAG
jgi:superfamily II DNA helicase RecQ